MFDRNRIESTAPTTSYPAEIVLDDGRTLKGRFIVAAQRGIQEVLNGPGSFVEFEAWGEERCFIAKATLRSVRLMDVPAAQSLAGRAKASEGFDPHMVLGVSQTASWEEIRAAYHARAMAYHPDRYATAELPTEVREYLAAMARRITAAYRALEGAQQVVRKITTTRAEAVFVSPAR